MCHSPGAGARHEAARGPWQCGNVLGPVELGTKVKCWCFFDACRPWIAFWRQMYTTGLVTIKIINNSIVSYSLGTFSVGRLWEKGKTILQSFHSGFSLPWEVGSPVLPKDGIEFLPGHGNYSWTKLANKILQNNMATVLWNTNLHQLETGSLPQWKSITSFNFLWLFTYSTCSSPPSALLAGSCVGRHLGFQAVRKRRWKPWLNVSSWDSLKTKEVINQPDASNMTENWSRGSTLLFQDLVN